MPPISNALAAVYATAPREDYYIETLELSHSAFPNGARFITNQLAGWTANLENGAVATFDYLPFAAIPPNSAEDNNISLNVAIDNASVELMEQLEALAAAPTEAIIIRYRVYLASSAEVQNDPPLKLDILSVTANQDVITFTAGLSNLRAIPFPNIVYSTALYPGLKR
jgi:hypothetical protein